MQGGFTAGAGEADSRTGASSTGSADAAAELSVVFSLGAAAPLETLPAWGFMDIDKASTGRSIGASQGHHGGIPGASQGHPRGIPGASRGIIGCCISNCNQTAFVSAMNIVRQTNRRPHTQQTNKHDHIRRRSGSEKKADQTRP